MFIFTEHRPMTDKPLNTEYEKHPPNSSVASETQLHIKKGKDFAVLKHLSTML
jgi:hypothetical protein